MKKKITIAVSIIAVVIALLAVLYFTGVFSGSKSNNSPELATAPVSVESTAENSTTPENHTAEELKAEVPVEEVKSEVAEAEVLAKLSDNKAEVAAVPASVKAVESAETASSLEAQQPVDQQSAAQESEHKPEPQPQQTSGAAMYNGHPVRAVNSVSELGSPQKPFETVMVNGEPYMWNGSNWGKRSTEKAQNLYSEIHLENGQWSGEHVGF